MRQDRPVPGSAEPVATRGQHQTGAAVSEHVPDPLRRMVRIDRHIRRRPACSTAYIADHQIQRAPHRQRHQRLRADALARSATAPDRFTRASNSA